MKKRCKEGHYLPIPRLIFKHQGYKKLTVYSKLILFHLFELEHSFIKGNKKTYFFRSDENLAKDIGISRSQVIRAKKEFIELIPDILEIGYVHWWVDEEHTKLSKRKVTKYEFNV